MKIFSAQHISKTDMALHLIISNVLKETDGMQLLVVEDKSLRLFGRISPSCVALALVNGFNLVPLLMKDYFVPLFYSDGNPATDSRTGQEHCLTYEEKELVVMFSKCFGARIVKSRVLRSYVHHLFLALAIQNRSSSVDHHRTLRVDSKSVNDFFGALGLNIEESFPGRLGVIRRNVQFNKELLLSILKVATDWNLDTVTMCKNLCSLNFNLTLDASLHAKELLNRAGIEMIVGGGQFRENESDSEGDSESEGDSDSDSDSEFYNYYCSLDLDLF